jgi:hypothetical protein
MCRYLCIRCNWDWTDDCVVKPKCKCKIPQAKYCHHCLPLVVKSAKEERLEWKVVLQECSKKTEDTQQFESLTLEYSSKKVAIEQYNKILPFIETDKTVSVTAYDPLTQKWEEPILTRPGIF